MNPFFSVVIPIYNAEKYLHNCISSITATSFTDYEIILVNDGSTDKSPTLCDELSFNNEKIKVIHKNNGGAASARNEGIKAARGEYLIFIDADDFIREGSLEEIKNFIKNNDYPDLVCLNIKKYYSFDGSSVDLNEGFTEKINSANSKETKLILAELNKFPGSPCGKAIKSSLVKDNEIMFINGLLCEDLEWNANLFSKIRNCKYYSPDFYFYRQDIPNSCSKVFNEKKAKDVLFIVEKWGNYAKDLIERNENTETALMIRSFMEYTYRFLIIYAVSIDKKIKKDYMQKIKSHDWLLGIRQDKVSKIIKLSYTFLGIHITGKLLKLYLKMRK